MFFSVSLQATGDALRISRFFGFRVFLCFAFSFVFFSPLALSEPQLQRLLFQPGPGLIFCFLFYFISSFIFYPPCPPQLQRARGVRPNARAQSVPLQRHRLAHAAAVVCVSVCVDFTRRRPHAAAHRQLQLHDRLLLRLSDAQPTARARHARRRCHRHFRVPKYKQLPHFPPSPSPLLSLSLALPSLFLVFILILSSLSCFSPARLSPFSIGSEMFFLLPLVREATLQILTQTRPERSHSQTQLHRAIRMIFPSCFGQRFVGPGCGLGFDAQHLFYAQRRRRRLLQHGDRVGTPSGVLESGFCDVLSGAMWALGSLGSLAMGDVVFVGYVGDVGDLLCGLGYVGWSLRAVWA